MRYYSLMWGIGLLAAVLLVRKYFKDMKIDLERFDPDIREGVVKLLDSTKDNEGMTFAFAVNYGGRDEIVRACKKYAKDYKEGKVNDLDEETFKNYLYTKDLPEVDLLIRTSYELRVSNYLLYQIAYSEFIFTETLWPDFTPEELDKCIEEYENRKRNFGGRNETKNN